MKTYYIERHASGTVGNCLLFWKHDDNGYTCDIKKAKRFTEEQAMNLLKSDSLQKYTAWDSDMLDSIAVLHIDYQKLTNKMRLDIEVNT